MTHNDQFHPALDKQKRKNKEIEVVFQRIKKGMGR